MKYLPGLCVIPLIMVAAPAPACRVPLPIDIGDVRYADLVVVGRVTGYRIVLDEEVRERRRRSLADPDLPASLRRDYQMQTSFLTDYARFEVEVDERLAGEAPNRLTVTWQNSTFGEPDSLPPGPFLLALRRPNSESPPLRGPSATIVPNREPDLPTLLQAPCAPAFIMPASSEVAARIRALLQRRP